MLGFSLAKLLLLAAILYGVWYAFRHIGRLDRDHRRSLRDRVMRAAARHRAEETPPERIETVRCATCGIFVPAEAATNCGKPGCPY